MPTKAQIIERAPQVLASTTFMLAGYAIGNITVTITKLLFG
ncbi:hypothetical protein [Pontixanthobacter gangjinensis]|nr:hypothetical protein [Pontixanthobacter gangjinensis]